VNKKLCPYCKTEKVSFWRDQILFRKYWRCENEACAKVFTTFLVQVDRKDMRGSVDFTRDMITEKELLQ
jgi:hypothetical protein